MGPGDLLFMPGHTWHNVVSYPNEAGFNTMCNAWVDSTDAQSNAFSDKIQRLQVR
jgi:hypothetical protein